MKNIKHFISEDECAGRAKMIKRGQFSGLAIGRKAKKLPSICKDYASRRLAIKRGESGSQAQYGRIGHSSYWW
jgi:hypothetical protein